MRAIAIGVLTAVAAFLVLIARAMKLYPGGTWFDTYAIGHDALRNFLCDLTQTVALNGVLNPGAPIARLAMLVLDAGLLLVWIAIPWLTPPSRLARWLRMAGFTSFVGIVAVPFTPSLELGVIHAFAVLTATLPGIVAGVLAAILLARSAHSRLYRLCVAMLGVSAVDAVLYVHHVLSSAPPVLALPALQRVALGLLLAWMLAIAVTLLRSPFSPRR